MRVAAAVIALLLSAPLQAVEVTKAAGFELQSSFWVNLHQRLFHNGAVEAPKLDALTPEDRAVWLEAMKFYARYKGRFAHSDPELTVINDTLTFIANDAPLPKTVPASVREVLETAAPVYRRLWWADDDRSNRFWIAMAAGMLREAGDVLKREHARVYEMEWPRLVRVDVTSHADVFGAYTSKGPHTVISSQRPGNQGYYALEALFHEASHEIVDSSYGTVGDAINKHAKRLGTEPPRLLWHTIIFYTSGELTRRALARRGVDNYVPYAEAHKARDWSWSKYSPLLRKSWQDHIEGKLTLDEAIGQLVEALK